MSEDSIFQHYQTVGDLRLALATAGSLEEALERCLSLVAQACRAELAVLWFPSPEDGRLHPLSWIGPLDLTTSSCPPDDGVVGQVFRSGSAACLLDYSHYSRHYAGIHTTELLRSMICVPLRDKEACLGCLQLINRQDGGHFDQEEAELCRLLARLAAAAIVQEGLLPTAAPSRPMLLRLEAVTRSYPHGDTQLQALNGVDLQLFEGEFLAIVGPSGSGKSTLLNIIGGLDRPTSGRFLYQEEDYSQAPDKLLTAYRRDQLGFIFPHGDLLQHLTARQNLRYQAELQPEGLPPEQAIAQLCMEDWSDRYPEELSEGQQRLVAVARALVKQPRLILADEPTAALDAQAARSVLAALSFGVSRGSALLLVTHDEELCRLAQRVLRLREGRLTQARINRQPVQAENLAW